MEIKRKNIASLLKGSASNRKIAAFDHSATTFLTLVFPTSWGIRPESSERIYCGSAEKGLAAKTGTPSTSKNKL